MITLAFTFHYVSINSHPFNLENKILYLFTFHYVSINSATPAVNTTAFSKFTFHYVSINSMYEKKDMYTVIEFTFHYVSINSNAVESKCFQICHLHSTMYLLILVTPNSTYFKPSTPTFCRPNISYSYYLTKFLTILSNK